LCGGLGEILIPEGDCGRNSRCELVSSLIVQLYKVLNLESKLDTRSVLWVVNPELSIVYNAEQASLSNSLSVSLVILLRCVNSS
jgi:hypothetical protein